jgi:hypothetical protein
LIVIEAMALTNSQHLLFSQFEKRKKDLFVIIRNKHSSREVNTKEQTWLGSHLVKDAN